MRLILAARRHLHLIHADTEHDAIQGRELMPKAVGLSPIRLRP